ncbi:hypothetical protein AAFF_G00339200 [Aldrovandia affinis]|uniref:Uncharacterized protein n=1 Tax=Aldrovandia affinis TaxID=143900 RepID=A0AAD7SK66_9TELE|nr:hypothetical protein AAFF_G00339200 [Aldrovandia affinis]
MVNVLSPVAEEYYSWLAAKQERVRASNENLRSSRSSLRSTVASASQTRQAQLGPPAGRPWTTFQPDPEIRACQNDEDVPDYRRTHAQQTQRSLPREKKVSFKTEDSGLLSHYTQQYRGLRGAPAMSGRPADHLQCSTCPFASSTEYRAEYRGLQGDVTTNMRLRATTECLDRHRDWLKPLTPKCGREYVRLQGKMDFSTSYGREYKAPENGERRFTIQPRDQIKMPRGAFLGTTSYNTDYQHRRTRWG